MAVAGIVCEYNPFHRGHLRQLETVRAGLGRNTPIVCVMSGNYVQRGEPAIFHKQLRARAAVDAGVSLVLELPLTACLSSAEGFAAGAVEVLDRLGMVTSLSFGCESPDLETLNRLTDCLLSDAFSPALREYLNRGAPFAKARELAVQSLCGLGDVLNGPNNILAVEYCKALKRRGSAIQPLPLHRPGSYHDTPAPDRRNPAAATVRRLMMEDASVWRELVPEGLAPLYESAPRYALAYGERAVLAMLRTSNRGAWEQAPHSGEGLHNRLRKAVLTQPDLASAFRAAASGRYPTARLRRLAMCVLLGVAREDLANPLEAVRILAFDDRGRDLLRQAQVSGKLQLFNAGAAHPDAVVQALERRAADVYALFCRSLSAAVPGGLAGERIYYRKRR